MSLSKFTGETNNIQSLADQPTETANEIKAKFDKTGTELKEYINNTLTEEIDLELANKANSNNTYNKTEVDELINGTVLAENKILSSNVQYRFFTLNDTIKNYKCIEIILDDGTVLRKTTPQNGALSFLLRFISYIDEDDGSLICSKVEFGLSENRAEIYLSHGYSYDYSYIVDTEEEGKIRIVKRSTSGISIKKIIGYK